ncbi:hypothetical protein BGZ70_003299 [Mortierella alpina]|uniref:Transmembrane protein 198 n=1 Tax=Mortierella alpina TaxID=64518 RepID=A0A9P6JAS6_MORAP|nr:hypothetical protein BGZ70_003299 [Mortierella alpina]
MGAPQHSISSKLKSSMQLLCFLMLSLLAFAQQDPNQPNPPNNNDNDMLGDGRSINLTWQRIVAGLVLLLVGVILTFRGYRHYRFTMFLAGFIAGCVIIYSILTNVEPAQGWDNRQIIYVFSCIGGGLVLGFVCWLLHRFTIWILGGITGLAIALYLLAWRNEGLIRSKGGRIGLLVGASVLGLLIALFMGRRILIPATAIVGAYITVIGIDLFARTGFSESIKRFFTTDSNVNYTLTTNLYIMLGCVAGLMLLGVIFQTLAWRHRQRALIAQGRTVHDYEHDWSLCGRRRNRTVRPDPNYPDGHYDNTYDNHRYVNDPNAVPGTATTTQPGLNDTVYTEKKSWNPFKKHKTATTTPVHNPAYPDNRVSYSSNAALNQ